MTQREPRVMPRDVLREEFRAAYRSAMEWAEKQEVYLAEQGIENATAIGANIEHHFRRFLAASLREAPRAVNAERTFGTGNSAAGELRPSTPDTASEETT